MGVGTHMKRKRRRQISHLLKLLTWTLLPRWKSWEQRSSGMNKAKLSRLTSGAIRKLRTSDWCISKKIPNLRNLELKLCQGVTATGHVLYWWAQA